MNRPSQLKRALCAVTLSLAATAVAGAANVCQITSQEGLTSCKKSAQSDYWNAVGMCVNMIDPQSQQACMQKAKSDQQTAMAEIGGVGAPLIGGILADRFGPGVPFLAYAPLLVLSAVLLAAVGRETLQR